MDINRFKSEIIPLKDKLFRFALMYLKNTEKAEDIVHDVFIKLWSKKDDLKKVKNIEAFSMVITKNLCLDNLKSKKNKTCELIDYNSGISDKTPYYETQNKDIGDKIRQIMDTLPEQQKSIIHMRDIEGYGFEEISEILNINTNTIRVNLSRARQKIKNTLIEVYNYEPSGY
ncbi:MAG: RNA polymerase sigma factor [Bacteroidales bacterium]|nr:RNA polymerase sigma factor [Bacteroidales bacterium]